MGRLDGLGSCSLVSCCSLFVDVACATRAAQANASAMALGLVRALSAATWAGWVLLSGTSAPPFIASYSTHKAASAIAPAGTARITRSGMFGGSRRRGFLPSQLLRPHRIRRESREPLRRPWLCCRADSAALTGRVTQRSRIVALECLHSHLVPFPPTMPFDTCGSVVL